MPLTLGSGRATAVNIRGVSRKSGYGWAGTIEYNGKKRHLGYFENEIDAARAYNNAAEELFGEYACLNLVPRKPPASADQEQHTAIA